MSLIDCGIAPEGIVGGSEVTPYSLPWQVGLVSPGDDTPWCGGTIIGPNHILTAAHCMGGSFEIIVGEHDVTDTDDGTRHTVCSTISHPDYNEGTTNYDYAIVVLNEPIVLGSRAVPACLPDASFGGNFLDDKTETVMIERESVKKPLLKRPKTFWITRLKLYYISLVKREKGKMSKKQF